MHAQYTADFSSAQTLKLHLLGYHCFNHALLMETTQILDIVKRISISEDITNGYLEYNPLEVFVNRTREKEICHTSIIADLLNPNGRHRLGSIFLSSFINHLGVDKKCNLNEAKVRKERPIQSSLPNKHIRSIDICIEFVNAEEKYAIIIENKMNNAPEQIRQIEDYKKGLEKEGYEVLKTVCLQGSSYKNIGADLYIEPKELSSIFTVSMPNTEHGIKSYLMLLKNMNKETDLLRIAEEIWNMEDDDIKKIRKITSSFNAISKHAFKEIINHLNKETSFNFQRVRPSENTGDIYDIISDSCLQLWHEESYQKGHNHSFWIEIWFHEFYRFVK